MAKEQELPEDEGLDTEDVETEIVDDELDDDDVDAQLDTDDEDDGEEEEPAPWYSDFNVDGFDEKVLGNFQDPKEFARQLVSAHRDRIKQYEDQLRQAQYQFAQQNQPRQVAPPKDDTPKKSKADELREKYREGFVEWKPEYERLLKRDPETGDLVAIPGADPSLPQKYLQHQEFLRSRVESFVADPIAFMQENVWPAFYEQVQQDFSKADQSSVTQLQYEHDARTALQGNASWMIDQNSGQLTQAGQQYAQAVQMLEPRGFSPREADQMAKQMVFGPSGPPQPQAPPPAETPTEKRNKSNINTLRNGASRRRNKPGRAPKAGRSTEVDPQGNDLSEMLRNGLEAAGIQDEDLRR